jgi:glycosyltransferase involved in cell wall biosynthesis
MFAACMPLAMIGYDALPMTHPENYRFPPGTAARVSEYFRLLATADAVVCISDFARASLWDRLRRDRSRTTTVAHPGGDHVIVEHPRAQTSNQPMILRVGTLEARKLPLETVDACRAMADQGWQGRMVLIGRPSASDPAINAAVDAAANAGIGLTWIQDASDDDVQHHLSDASLFLSLGTEGYGIPVLEALGRGVPVVYDGIQPAAELMDGKGASRIDSRDTHTLARGLIDACRQRDVLASAIDPTAIPTWRDFVRGVVSAL